MRFRASSDMLVCICFIAAVGCAPLTASTGESMAIGKQKDEAPPGYRKLKSAEIAAVLRGRSINLGTSDQPHTGRRYENFAPAGEWQAYTEARGPLVEAGKWASLGDKLCVEIPEKPALCRFVWVSPNGKRLHLQASPPDYPSLSVGEFTLAPGWPI